eukprot:gene3745-6633_t
MSQSSEISKRTEEETEEVKTLFVSGLPLNVREREIYLLFQQCPGYDSSTIKLKAKSAVAFVLFDDNKTASNAIDKINGTQFDPDSSNKIKVELAKNNTKIQKRERSTTPENHSEKRMKHNYPQSSFFQNGFYNPVLSRGLFPITPPPGPLNIEEYSNYFNDFYYQPSKGCNTIFIANLDSSIKEKDILDLCCKIPGYSRMKMLRGENKKDPVCFVEFYDVNYAHSAIRNLTGVILKGMKNPIRVEFAKNEMGEKKK